MNLNRLKTKKFILNLHYATNYKIFRIKNNSMLSNSSNNNKLRRSNNSNSLKIKNQKNFLITFQLNKNNEYHQIQISFKYPKTMLKSSIKSTQEIFSKIHFKISTKENKIIDLLQITIIKRPQSTDNKKPLNNKYQSI